MSEVSSMKAIFERLAAPFDPADIEWRAGATNADKTSALALAYITSRAVMDRLDEVVGAENWRDEYAPGPGGGIVCGISLRIGGEWVTKWDGAENTDFEAIKGGLSDAFKRAGYKWGIGRYLYRLDSVWVKCEARGKFVQLKEIPQLPAWALPAGYKSPAASKPAAGKVKSEANAVEAVQPDHTWAGFLGYCQEKHNLSAEAVQERLKAKGHTRYAEADWDRYLKIVTA